MVIELTSVADAALPVEAFKAHLRMGTAFSVEDVQDEVLTGFLRAAIAGIEARTDKVLIARDFSVTCHNVRRRDVLGLPLAPVSGIARVVAVSAEGIETDLTLERFRLEQDAQVPRLRGPIAVPSQGELRVELVAGYGATWDEVPADLRQAVMMLAAHYYEYRDDTALSPGCMPFGVSSLIERYRHIRIGRGAEL